MIRHVSTSRTGIVAGTTVLQMRMWVTQHHPARPCSAAKVRLAPSHRIAASAEGVDTTVLYARVTNAANAADGVHTMKHSAKGLISTTRVRRTSGQRRITGVLVTCVVIQIIWQEIVQRKRGLAKLIIQYCNWSNKAQVTWWILATSLLNRAQAT